MLYFVLGAFSRPQQPFFLEVALILVRCLTGGGGQLNARMGHKNNFFSLGSIQFQHPEIALSIFRMVLENKKKTIGVPESVNERWVYPPKMANRGDSSLHMIMQFFEDAYKGKAHQIAHCTNMRARMHAQKRQKKEATA